MGNITRDQFVDILAQDGTYEQMMETIFER